MTGAELIQKIQELEAENKDVLCLSLNGLISGADNVSVAPDAVTGKEYVIIS